MSNIVGQFDHAGLIKSETLCLFGKNALITMGPICKNSEDQKAFPLRVAKDFNGYVSSGTLKKSDAYMVVYEDEKYGQTLETLCKTVRDLFNALSQVDPAGQHCMNKTVDDPAWKFTYAGEVFYPLTTAPCYPKDSSRYNHGSSSTYVFFIPQNAFRRRYKEGQSALSEKSKEVIRRKHAEHGRPYDLAISLGSRECYKIVKPLRLNEPVVRWWQEGVTL